MFGLGVTELIIILVLFILVLFILGIYLLRALMRFLKK